MKDKDIHLSVGELETLCNLYIECKLSALEEKELFYVLLKTDKESAVINETKAIMGIERRLANSKQGVATIKPFYKRAAFYAAAACFALLIALTAVFVQFGEDTIPETPLLSQSATEESRIDPEAEIIEQQQITPEPPADDVSAETAFIEPSKPKRAALLSHEIKPENIGDDYIEITDEKTASIIMQEIDGKLTAIWDKGINAGNEIPDIKEIMDNAIKKI